MAPIWTPLLYSHLSGKCPHPLWIPLSCWRDYHGEPCLYGFPSLLSGLIILETIAKRWLSKSEIWIWMKFTIKLRLEWLVNWKKIKLSKLSIFGFWTGGWTKQEMCIHFLVLLKSTMGILCYFLKFYKQNYFFVQPYIKDHVVQHLYANL